MKNKWNNMLFMAGSLACGLTSCTTPKEKAPNVLFIMADQWRGNAIGYLGIEPVQTPHIDGLAQEGVHFVNAASGYPVSSPARAMLMTGMYPTQNGVIGNCNSHTAPYGVELKEETQCWSDVWSQNGYNMGYIGKWHLDSPHEPFINTSNNRGEIAWNEWCPANRRHGFEHWIAYGTYDYHLKPMYWNTNDAREDFYYVNQWGPEYEADQAIHYIQNKEGKYRDSDKPFSLVVSFNPPHTGYELVPDKYKEVYKDLDVEALANQPHIPAKGTPNGDYFRKNVRNYYACMTGVDEQVGRLIETLKKENLYDNTILVFTSDHGDQMGMHNCIGKNIYYEESMHIPLIIKWKGHLEPRQDEMLISLEDLNPTLTSLIGLGKDIPASVQTFDVSQHLLNNTTDDTLFQPYFHVDVTNTLNGKRGLRNAQYTYAIEMENGKIIEEILFDRIADPYQLSNKLTDLPQEATQLKEQLIEFLKDTNDPFANNFKLK